MEDKNYKTALGLLIKSISDGPASTKSHQLILQLGPTPQVLLDQGMPQLPMAINGRVIDKCFFDHGMTKPMLERIYSNICAPKAIYRSSNGEPGCVVMSAETKDAKPIIISVRSNHQMAGRRDYYNAVTSMYDKGGDVEIRWKKNGWLLWENVTKK